MLINKWLSAAMSAAVLLSGAAAAFDWTSIMSPEKAGAVAGAIGLVKLVLNAVQPAGGQTVMPTNGTIVTHS